MCRSIVEGGRRCPHESSAARHARRINSHYRDAAAPATIEPVTYDTNINHQEPLKKVRTLINQLDEIITNDNFPVTINNHTVNTLSEAKQYYSHLIEQNVRQLGASIINNVEQKTGIMFQNIVDELAAEQANIIQQTEQLMVEEEVLLDKLGEHFNEQPPYSKLVFDKLRLAHHQNPDDGTLNNFKQTLDMIDSTRNKLRDEQNNINYGYSENIKQKYATNINALMDMLNTVRGFGGKLNVSHKSDKTKTVILQQVAQYYPTEWVNVSNSSPVELAVKKTLRRAHYTHYSNTAKVIPFYRVVEHPHDYVPEDDSTIKVEANSEGWVKYENENLNITVDTYVGEGGAVWLEPQWEYASKWHHRFKRDGTPTGPGWEKHVDGKGVERYRRVIKRRITSVDYNKANLLVDEHVNPVNNVRGFDSAIHELGHRMEAVHVPHLSLIQEAFYNRRTEGQPHTRLYKGKSEYSIPDSFASDYMGKTYNDSTHFEILTTGMESIFGGSYAGGLVGLNSKKPDYDMRNFIVGLLAGV